MKRFFFLLFFTALTGFAAETSISVNRYVTDHTSSLSNTFRHKLNEELAAFERETSHQVVVIMIPTLNGEEIEEAANRLFRKNKIGQKGKNNGVLFLIAKNDRKMRIEVGYGLEGVLTDAKSSRILDGVKSHFRSGSFEAGIKAGVTDIEKIIKDPNAVLESPLPSQQKTPIWVGIFVCIVLGVFSMISVLSEGVFSFFMLLFLTPFYVGTLSLFFPMIVTYAVTGIFYLVWIVMRIFYWTPAGKKWVKKYGMHPHPDSRGSYWSGGGGGGDWGGGGSSGGDSGFSGGGGDSGGGGSSSSW